MRDFHITARGRNGYFKLSDIQAYRIPNSHQAFVEVFSKKIGNQAPIYFSGKAKDLIDMFKEIISQLK